jgi:transcriptional regulator with XRE-family HTH domain
MNYSKAIRIIRSAKGLEQKELASILKLDPSYVSLLEKGKRKPSQKLLDSISKKLSIPSNLFNLLASEANDLNNISKKESLVLAKHLLKILLTEENEKR